MSNKAGTIIDITYLINQRKVKKLIKKQLEDLEIDEFFCEECIVKFKNGNPTYIGIIWDRKSGKQLQLDHTFDVTRALSKC